MYLTASRYKLGDWHLRDAKLHSAGYYHLPNNLICKGELDCTTHTPENRISFLTIFRNKLMNILKVKQYIKLDNEMWLRVRFVPSKEISELIPRGFSGDSCFLSLKILFSSKLGFINNIYKATKGHFNLHPVPSISDKERKVHMA